MGFAAEWQGQREKIKRLFTGSLADLNPLRRQGNFVAVDIGSSSIKILEARNAPEGFSVVNWGTMPTPPSAIQSNMVAEPDRVSDALKALLEAKGVLARKAITAVPGPAVMIKRVNMPSQTPQEIEQAIMFEARNFIPEELDNVNLDYQVLGTNDAKEKEVLLAAAKKDIVSSYSDTLRGAGLAPVVVDVDYFALDNMYELNYEAVAGQVVALINIGARYSSINILKGGRSTFTGDVPVGGRDITEALTRELGISAEEADRLKTGNTQGSDFDGEQLSAALTPAVDALIEEIHYALSFFWTAATDERIDMLYLSGGAAQTPELANRLAERTEAPVELTDPFARISLDPSAGAGGLQQRAAEFAVAMGLAVRRPVDK